MHVWVERAVGLDLDEALLLERAPQRPLDQANALDERGLLVPLGGLERSLEVVEDADFEVIDEEEAKRS